MKEGFRQSMAWLHAWSGLLVGWLPRGRRRFESASIDPVTGQELSDARETRGVMMACTSAVSPARCCAACSSCPAWPVAR